MPPVRGFVKGKPGKGPGSLQNRAVRHEISRQAKKQQNESPQTMQAREGGNITSDAITMLLPGKLTLQSQSAKMRTPSQPSQGPYS
jgi:hypothetical protein